MGEDTHTPPWGQGSKEERWQLHRGDYGMERSGYE